MGRLKLKVCSFVIALFIAFSVVPALRVNAATSGNCGANGANVTWSISGSTLTISGTGAMADYTSTSNVPWYPSKSSIKSVVISSGVTRIGNMCFKSCNCIETVSIPSTVTSIGEYAFQACSALKSASIPNSVTTIGKGAFLSCSKMTSLTLSNKLTSLNYQTFKSCSSLTSLTIPSSITVIGSQAFYGCSNLTTAAIPSGVTSIGSAAFQDCKKLSSVSLPSGLVELGDSAFKNCTSITSVTIPSNITTILADTFNGCTNLKTVNLPSTLIEIGHLAFFKCTNLSSITLPEGITSVGDNVFTDCTSLTSFTIPASVTQFGHVSLAGCSNIHEVTYNGTHEQWLTIDTWLDDENYTMDDAFAELGITVIFAGGENNVRITKQPVSTRVRVGELATFKVTATGTGLKYQWQVFTNEEWTNCSMNDGAKTDTLTLEGTAARDGLQYRCVVTDASQDFVTSDIVTLYVNVPPQIRTQPKSCSVQLNGTATFTVDAYGTGLAYQWQVFSNGEWVNCSINDGAKTATLSLQATAARDGLKYRCVLSTVYDDVTVSDEATLTVIFPLSIKTQPSNFTGNLGSTATFNVVATGSGLKYQWQVFSNGEWTNCSMNDGAKTDTLTLEATASRDGSKYHCVITDANQESVTTNEVTLSVIFPLEIVTQPSDYQARLGANATYLVEVSGTGLKYQWQVFSNGEWTNCSMNDGAKTNILTLEATASRDGSKYHCVITDVNQDTVTTREVTLTVVFPTEIESQPEDFWCRLGSEAEFTVSATGTGLKYQWQVFTNGEWTNCSVNDGAKTDTLILEATTSRDGMKYHCVITNLFGDVVTTDEATLYVIFPLKITQQPQNFTGTVGSTATFTVAASGEELSYQWQTYKNGEWVNCSNKDGATTDTLTLEAKESRNGTKYRCIVFDVMNEEQAISNEATLTVEVPLAITTQPSSLTCLPDTTATFTIKASGLGLKYQWQVLKNGTWTNCSVNDGAKTAKLTIAATSSRNGTKYHCIVTDSTGAKLTSNTAILTVESPLAITTQPSNFSGSENEMATFTVVATGSGLKYQWQVNKSGSWTNCSVNDGAKTATLSLAATANRNGTKYRCVITDSTGASVTSSTATLTVDIPLAITTQPSSISVEGGGNAIFTVKASGVGLKYQWQVLKNGTWTNCSMNDGAKTNKLTIEATASRNGLKYHCIVTDASGAKLTSNSAVLTVLIPLEITAQPENATCENEGDMAVYTVEANGVGLKYQWQVYKDGEWVNCSKNDGAKTNTLTIKATASRNGSKYHCIITDANGATVTSNDALMKIINLFANPIDLNAENAQATVASDAVAVSVPAEDVADIVAEDVAEAAVEEVVVVEVAEETVVPETFEDTAVDATESV